MLNCTPPTTEVAGFRAKKFMIYLDNAATTKPFDEVVRTYMSAVEKFGNASSAYRLGTQNLNAINAARAKIAAIINADPEEIYFTSGGTESDNWALRGVKIDAIITDEIEHPAILNTAKALDGIQQNNGKQHSYYCTLKHDGRINMQDYEIYVQSASKCLGRVLCSVMMVNNEIGTIQPIKSLASIAHANNGIFHTDAVQAMGHRQIDVKDLDVDMLSASAHKFHGMKGSGFLYVKKGIELSPFITGGHQQNSMRGGTYNTPGILAMARALEICNEKMKEDQDQLNALNEYLKDGLQSIGIKKFNSPKNAVPYIVNFRTGGVKGEELLSYLDMMDIFISTGSACTSDDDTPSHVLKAIGLSDDGARESIRVSMSYDTTKDDIDDFIGGLKNAMDILKGR